MTFRSLHFEDNINSAATNNLGYFFLVGILICRLTKFLLGLVLGDRVINTLEWRGCRELEVDTVGKSINWNNLSRGQSGCRHKKPKNICAL